MKRYVFLLYYLLNFIENPRVEGDRTSPYPTTPVPTTEAPTTINAGKTISLLVD